jgi:2-octaprenyl-6-methoxyphenol hydroxylase
MFLHFDHRDLGEQQGATTPFGWMVEARALRMALNARLNDPSADAGRLTCLAPAEATVERRADGATVTIAGGPVLSCRLVVAADGRASRVRAEAGIPVTTLPYRQSGIVCAIAHERPHNGVALEHFLPAGPFAQLPMAPSEAGDNISAIVWSERAHIAPQLMALDNDRFGAEIALRLGDHLGAIRPVGRRWIYPLSAMYVHHLTAERLAIVGDAAHGIHPIAGQGLNLGLRDAAALSDLILEAHGAGEDIGSPALLARYQRARRLDTIAMLVATDGLERLFSTDNPLARAARDLGIAAVHRMPGLKKAFMRQAMGVA